MKRKAFRSIFYLPKTEESTGIQAPESIIRQIWSIKTKLTVIPDMQTDCQAVITLILSSRQVKSKVFREASFRHFGYGGRIKQQVIQSRSLLKCVLSRQYITTVFFTSNFKIPFRLSAICMTNTPVNV